MPEDAVHASAGRNPAGASAQHDYQTVNPRQRLANPFLQ
jgi:hypothetical protein